jgi:hypothetical protein
MKSYFNYYLKAFFVLNIIYILISLVIFQRTTNINPFIRLELGVLFSSVFIAGAIKLFKTEKGNTIINVILAYIAIIPSLIILRNSFGTFLFRNVSRLYILMVIIGIIYGIAVLIVSRKYKKEEVELNQMVKNNEEDSTEE